MLIVDSDLRASYIEMDQYLSTVPDLQGCRVQDKAAAYSGAVMVHQSNAKQGLTSSAKISNTLRATPQPLGPVNSLKS